MSLPPCLVIGHLSCFSKHLDTSPLGQLDVNVPLCGGLKMSFRCLDREHLVPAAETVWGGLELGCAALVEEGAGVTLRFLSHW